MKRNARITIRCIFTMSFFFMKFIGTSRIVVVSKKNRCRFDWIIGKKIRLCTEIFNNTKIQLTLNIIKWETKINQIRKSYTNLHLFNIQSRIHNLIFKNIYSFLLSRRLYYGNHHLFKNIENNPRHSHVNQYYFSIL